MRRAVPLLAALAVAAVACGSDDTATEPTATTAAVDTVVETSTPVTTTDDPPETTIAATDSAVETSDPTTTTDDVDAPSETDAGGAASDDPAAAASVAWATVFDSTVPFDDKAVHLADAAELRSTVEAYAAAGEGFGGISLEPTAAAVAGDTAEITYDVNFGPNPAYTDQTGTIVLADGTWTVSRDEFCSFMSSARVPCP